MTVMQDQPDSKSPTWRSLLLVAALGLLSASCGGGDDATSTTTVSGGGDDLMGGGALGGNADTELLADASEVAVPDGVVSWVAHEVRLADGDSLTHAHSFAFVWAAEGRHTVSFGDDEASIEQGGSVAVTANGEHAHSARDGDSVFWEIRLAAPDAGVPPGAQDAVLVFASEPLEGIPADPTASFVEVVIPPQRGETSVHTHPGPELIYQLSGDIIYENAIIGEIQLGPGGIESIPPDTAVQKRNLASTQAVFLSWFLLDPSQEFATGAAFAAPEIEGTNVAATSNGGEVTDVSSNFGGGAEDSRFGASKAIDEDPATEWSSDGDGDEAFLEIGFDQTYDIHTVTVQTRTMGDTAEITEFRLIAADGTDLGVFELPGPNRPVAFDVDVSTDRLRFEVVSSSGGNTGLVELGVFADTS